jgi:transcription initiation factor IIF auxiliary subunit
MALELKQDFEYEGQDWWEWSVWVDGSEQELDQIDYVEYTLHPTFPKPVQKIDDRSSQFRLHASGWGMFTIYAKIVHKDGKHTLREHLLELSYPDGHTAPA